MPVSSSNKPNNMPSLTQSMNNLQHIQFSKLIQQISSFQRIQQMQQFMVEFIYILHMKTEQDISQMHGILSTMLTNHKHLLNTHQLQSLNNSCKDITIATKISQTPSPNTIINPNTNIKKHKYKYKQYKRPQITHILSLPDHILSYCLTYLASKDLLLSADLCCKEMCRIARFPSSFHGKFIFGTAIHSEYHKLIKDGNKRNMLARFRYLREIHFINIFNYDTIQLLKRCNFPKIKAIYLYDRFNYLIQYLPKLIPNIQKLYILTAGGNETLDIISANNHYYDQQLYRLLNAYKHCINTIQLQHNTYYDIPLMLPGKITSLLLHGLSLQKLSLKNVYFPPNLSLEDADSDSDGGADSQTLHVQHTQIKKLRLRPYNEYCSAHFDPCLHSLSMHWNIVGENEVFPMVKLQQLRTFHLILHTNNDSLDYNALTRFLAQSQCLLHIKQFIFDIDLNDANPICVHKLLQITQNIFDIIANNCNICINIIDVSNDLFTRILPQIIIDNILNNMNENHAWNICVNIRESHQLLMDVKNMQSVVNNLKTNCVSLLTGNTCIKFVVANEIYFNLKSKSINDFLLFETENI